MNTKIMDVDFEQELLDRLPSDTIEQIRKGREIMKQKITQTFTIDRAGMLWGVQMPENMVGKRILVTMEVLP